MVTGDGDSITFVSYYHDHYSLSPSLPPNPNRYIRADFSTDGTARTGFILLPDDKEISLAVDLLSHPNQFFGTRDRAEATTLTSLSIDFNLGHGSLPTALGLRPEV